MTDTAAKSPMVVSFLVALIAFIPKTSKFDFEILRATKNSPAILQREQKYTQTVFYFFIRTVTVGSGIAPDQPAKALGLVAHALITAGEDFHPALKQNQTNYSTSKISSQYHHGNFHAFRVYISRTLQYF